MREEQTGVGSSIRAHITQYPSGGLEQWGHAGIVHRDYYDLPAEIYYREDGSISSKVWCHEGRQHRPHDLPAEIRYRENGSISLQRWRHNGYTHRDNDLPAVISYFKDGSIRRQEWWFNGQCHREHDLPASTEHANNGDVVLEEWCWHGQYWRSDDQPASIRYRDNGSVLQQVWYSQEEVHRDAGPAIIEANPDGSTISLWYLHGKFQKSQVSYPEPCFEDLVKPASGYKSDRREPAFSGNANSWEPASSVYVVLASDEE